MMLTPELLFYLFSAMLVASALGVISVRNPVYSVLFLILSFILSAGLWVLMQAEFLGLVLILVYVGAVMVLFLFVIMMLNVKQEVRMKTRGRLVSLFGLLVGVGFVGGLLQAIRATTWSAAVEREAAASNTRALGELLYTEYLYAFEIAGLLLLMAIIAAIALTHRKRPGHRAQDISAQVSVQAKDRVRLVDLPKETESS